MAAEVPTHQISSVTETLEKLPVEQILSKLAVQLGHGLSSQEAISDCSPTIERRMG